MTFSCSHRRVGKLPNGEFFASTKATAARTSLKTNSGFFSLCRVYSSLLKMSNVGNFPGVDLFGTSFKFGKRKTNFSSLVYVYSMKRLEN